jgi:uncharacterized protein YlzI (FlbEa/FlbD family)
MTPIDALFELFGRVGACQGAPVLVNDEELRQWPRATIEAMKSQKLIVKASPADSAICPGCERECVMPVHTPSAKGVVSSSFIVCDKRSDTNRVPISSAKLIQWQCSVDLVTEFVASSLGLRRPARQTASAGGREIGIAFGEKRSQMLCLEASGILDLVAGNKKIPLAEFIEFNGGKYSLNDTMIRQMVDASTTADERYTPSNARREARKLDTQAMYESWRKTYRELKRSKPGKPDNWYAMQIAKMEIAHGRDPETIRKNMKK